MSSTTCYRHPDRSAGVSCQRCGRKICPSCMIQASVGFHCPECVNQSATATPSYTMQTLPTSGSVVTYALIAVNVAVFLWDVTSGGTFARAGGIPYRNGFLSAVPVAGGEWWRLVTAGFLHDGLMHLGFNMFALYIIGRQLEAILGPWRYLSLYAAALLAGGLGAIITSPGGRTVGASGAVFGLFGAAAAYQYIHKINMMKSGLGPLLLINIAISFVPGISMGGHFGGLAAGALVGFGMFYAEERRQSPVLGVALAVCIGLGCIAVALSLAPSLIVIRR